MSGPSSKFVSQDNSSSATIQATDEAMYNEIIARRNYAYQMSSRLKVRLGIEEARLAVLVIEHESKGNNPDSPLAQRIAGTEKMIASVKRNYKGACDCFAAGYDLEILELAKARVVEAERRLLAVEVGLLGIERETGYQRRVAGTSVGESTAEDRFFKMDINVRETIEDERQDNACRTI
ncbi:hypothetical protein EJ07DRAFT_154267 [Lizonia empirigonia]|nr:hypothetical protein EJ07DRAFT_154267 [Lizonia empirigonia]